MGGGEMNDRCCVCLNWQNQSNKKFIPISSLDANNQRVSSKIIECSGITISESHPTIICSRCFKNLNVAYEFKMLCISSEKIIMKCNDATKRISTLESFKNIESENKEIKYKTSDKKLFKPGKLPTKLKKKSNIEDKSIHISVRKKIDIPIDNIKNNSKEYVCDQCGKSFKRNNSFKDHLERHNAVKSYMCSICGRQFSIKNELVKHTRVHNGQKPYKCKYCDRQFSDWGSRAKHERCHRGEKPYKCEICNHMFSYSYVLNRHKLIHGKFQDVAKK